MNGGWIQASVSMPCTASSQSRWRTGRLRRGPIGAPARPAASRQAVPQPAHRHAVRRPRDRSVRAARPAPRERSPARSVRNRDSASVSSRIHESSRPAASGIPCSTTARHRSSRDADARDRPPPRSRRVDRRAARRRPWAECVRMPACRDSATRPETVRARAASRRLRPHLRTAGARTRAACCGG